MIGKSWIVAGALCAAISVALGAFGAHGLPKQLAKQGVAEDAAEKRVQNLETGARYQMYHALALMMLGIWQLKAAELGSATGARPGQITGWLFVLGIVLFSGSLYAYAFTGITKFGMITPLGGVAMIAGWILLIFA